MSRKTTAAAKAIFVATAVAASAFGVSSASAAGGEVVTSAGPVAVPTGAVNTITIKGTGFTPDITGVDFISPTAVTCAAVVIVKDSKTLYAKTPDTCTSAGKQTVTLTGTGVATTVFNPTDARKTVTFVVPVSGTPAFTPAEGVAGSSFSVTGLTNLATSGVSATLGGKAVTGLELVGTDGFTAKVPGGVTPGAAGLVVKSGGVHGAAMTGFVIRSAVTTKPAVYARTAAAAPLVQISGLGFKPGGPSRLQVTICGQLATVSTAKPYTDKAIWVTPPAFAAIPANAHGAVDATDGGVCRVQVRVDHTGDTTYGTDLTAAAANGTDDIVSVNTAGSTFTYSAY